MNDKLAICEQFGHIIGGKGKMENGVCSVNLHRKMKVFVQGRQSTSVLPAGAVFESMDNEGNALNLAEIAILQEEIPSFTQAAVQQGLIISALHNHWIFITPFILYIHLQSVEPPLSFAKKLRYALSHLTSYPVQQ
ncbi:DUF1259 domain-containing protein [Halobacillus salinarum]|uniref:DUF1259 domain-containing protein n=1 Tax=Halobacillus salinarum TaxID=2932257 RepID=A0ABY4EN98_9BACI|nr:DUF1259 domain-containing protein [Halobacillus salinarum]UOQ45134.1 DUF1259 domain-containing protein [Halobacillus salinarum]